MNATVQLVDESFHCSAWRQKDASTSKFRIHGGRLSEFESRRWFGKTLECCVCSARPQKAKIHRFHRTHRPRGLPRTSIEVPFRSVGTALHSAHSRMSSHETTWSQTTVEGSDNTNAATFVGTSLGWKPWTMQVECERRRSDVVCPNRDTAPRMMVRLVTSSGGVRRHE